MVAKSAADRTFSWARATGSNVRMRAAAAPGLIFRGGGGSVVARAATSGGAPLGASPASGVGFRRMFWRQGRGSTHFFSVGSCSTGAACEGARRGVGTSLGGTADGAPAPHAYCALRQSAEPPLVTPPFLAHL